MYFYLIIDQNAGVIDSLQRSWSVCRGSLGTITLVFFVQFAIYLAGLIACLVGSIFAWPLGSLLIPVTYLALAETGSSRPADGEDSW